MDLAIRTRALTKRFDGEPVVDAVELDVHPGDIFGLLGPNGSGKSTTLRMITGLLRPTDGEIEVLGASPGSQPERVGALIEEAALYPYLSGRRNLELLARLVDADPHAVDRQLDDLGLADAADRPAGGYSTGMRQRLAIAGALVHEPELLLLDEPSAGLDPSGVVEVRDLLRSLGGGERTIVVSSHLLTEIDQICDRVAIINRGELAYQGPIDELREGDTDELRLRVGSIDEATRVLDDLGHDHGRDPDDVLIVAAGEADAPHRRSPRRSRRRRHRDRAAAAASRTPTWSSRREGRLHVELAKLVRRPALWWSSAAAAAMAIAFGYLIPYLVGPRTDGQPSPDRPSEEPGYAVPLELLLPERFVENAISGFPLFYLALTLVLGALSSGSEYQWRTVRSMVPVGPQSIDDARGQVGGAGGPRRRARRGGLRRVASVRSWSP
ncbi:MAG: ABC transporter ATP-binding protein [Ilumatobacteraceae bacterium]